MLKGEKVLNLEKLNYLRETFHDSDCVVFGCGPSLDEVSYQDMKLHLEDKMVVTIKQSHCRYGKHSDIHFFNDNNLIKYKYQKPETIKIFSSANPGLNLSKLKLLFKNSPDISFRIIAPPNMSINKLKESLSYTRDFEKWSIENSGQDRLWGPGIMHETVLPVLEYVGVKNIYTLGWDYEDPKKWNNAASSLGRMGHYYDTKFENKNDLLKMFVNPACGIFKQECELLIESSGEIFKYLENKGIHLKVLSENSYVSDLIPRVDYREI